MKISQNQDLSITKNKGLNYKFNIILFLLIIILSLSITVVKNKTDQEKERQNINQNHQTNTEIKTPIPNTSNQKEFFKVKRVIDGDTFELENGQRVRLIGINTPEIGKKEECFAKEAYLKTKELIEGKEVSLEKDISQTDKYGRLLRYAFINENFINEFLVREGFAQVATYPPDVKYQEIFLKAQKEARENSKGLWGKTCQANVKGTNISENKGYICDCNKKCAQMSSCKEAQYQLEICGCKTRDADNDGVACDGSPLFCQNSNNH